MTQEPLRVSLTETAALVTRALTERFPDTVFAVEARTPTMRSRVGPRSPWIAVTWIDGPQASAVHDVTAAFAGTRYVPREGRRRRQTHRVVDHEGRSRRVAYEPATIALWRQRR